MLTTLLVLCHPLVQHRQIEGVAAIQLVHSAAFGKLLHAERAIFFLLASFILLADHALRASFAAQASAEVSAFEQLFTRLFATLPIARPATEPGTTEVLALPAALLTARHARLVALLGAFRPVGTDPRTRIATQHGVRFATLVLALVTTSKHFFARSFTLHVIVIVTTPLGARMAATIELLWAWLPAWLQGLANLPHLMSTGRCNFLPVQTFNLVKLFRYHTASAFILVAANKPHGCFGAAQDFRQ